MKKSLVILAAEDETSDVWLLREALRGAEVDADLQVTRDGDEAIGYLQGKGEYGDRDRHPFPNLLLLDLKMPRMGGIEVLRWIKRQPQLKALRVIVLTSSEDISDVNEAYEVGANSFLVKPLEFINYPAMLQTLSKFWLHESQAPALERPPKANPSSLQDASAAE